MKTTDSILILEQFSFPAISSDLKKALLSHVTQLSLFGAVVTPGATRNQEKSERPSIEHQP